MNEELIKKFDDITEVEGLWSQICKEHVKEMNIPESMLDDAGSGICGVIGCCNESYYYIDFI